MRHQKSGFTLIELLTVIGIIGIMVSVVIGVTSMVRRKALVARTQASLEQIAIQLDEYLLTNGGYPEDLSEIKEQLPDSAIIDDGDSLDDGILRDVWNREYVYDVSIGARSYKLYSMGPLEGLGADDIYSGK